MKRTCFLLGCVMLLLALPSLAGECGSGGIAFQLERHRNISGHLVLRQVEVGSCLGVEPGYGVFAKWMYFWPSPDGFKYFQKNRAYLDGLEVHIRRTPVHTGKHLDVWLDYSKCSKQLAEIQLRSELDNIIEGSAAALFFTYNGVPADGESAPEIETLSLKVKGYRAKPRDFERSYRWQDLLEKWRPPRRGSRY